MHGELPDLAVYKVVEQLADCSIFRLVALAGVCKSWRSIVKELPIKELRLESNQELSHRACFQKEALAANFYRAATERKSAFFVAATKLLTNYRGFYCSGDAINDSVLHQLARGTGATERVTIESSVCVTDSSLTAVVLLSPKLKHLHLKDLPAVRGGFLPTLLRRLDSLESLTLSNLPAVNWSFVTACSARPYALPALTALDLTNISLSSSDQDFFGRLPKLQRLAISSHPAALWAAAQQCRDLEEVTLMTNSSECTDDCLAALLTAPSLRVLELCPRSFTLTCEQLRLAGMLNLRELRLDSQAFRLQPFSRASHSHIDNEGVKALVDSVCIRTLFQRGKQPFKLSLCGATAITHDAVSALLRLPLLSGLMLDGCHRISSIDKMRLVAKVKAGREMLDCGVRKQQQLNRLISCVA